MVPFRAKTGAGRSTETTDLSGHFVVSLTVSIFDLVSGGLWERIIGRHGHLRSVYFLSLVAVPAVDDA